MGAFAANYRGKANRLLTQEHCACSSVHSLQTNHACLNGFDDFYGIVLMFLLLRVVVVLVTVYFSFVGFVVRTAYFRVDFHTMQWFLPCKSGVLGSVRLLTRKNCVRCRFSVKRVNC